MFGQTMLVQQNMAHGIGVRARSSAALRQRAVQQFWRARFSAMWRGLWTALTGTPNDLKQLTQTAVNGRQRLGVQEIAIDQIAGSEGRALDFDAAFNPRRSHNQDRWVSVAVARQMGIALPPVDLIQVGEAYYVRDGHHRISVARALGQSTIDATVTAWQAT